MNDRPGSAGAKRYWVLGGRWVDDERHLVWPRIFGPYLDLESATEGARALNAVEGGDVRYHVVMDQATAA